MADGVARVCGNVRAGAVGGAAGDVCGDQAGVPDADVDGHLLRARPRPLDETLARARHDYRRPLGVTAGDYLVFGGKPVGV